MLRENFNAYIILYFLQITMCNVHKFLGFYQKNSKNLLKFLKFEVKT